MRITRTKEDNDNENIGAHIEKNWLLHGEDFFFRKKVKLIPELAARAFLELERCRLKRRL